MGGFYINSEVWEIFVKRKVVGKREEINLGRDKLPDALDSQRKLERFLLMVPGNL
jgi:hypothetical protein